MADIYFYQEDESDESDGCGDSDSTQNPDDDLPPIEKLEKYVASEYVSNRQTVAHNVLDTLRNVIEDGSDYVDAVLNIMNRLADDEEASVRAELMEQVPHIAMYCQEMRGLLSRVVPHHLLPMVVKFLTDGNGQVRKTSRAALLVLLEQGLVGVDDVQEQVCPVVLKLTEINSVDDYRTEAVALLSKMAPLIGKDMVEAIFLDRFANLCLDPLFHIRKVCAGNFGDFSSVVGSYSTETVLLPKFFYLCQDGVWGVRKACAEVFMPVSCVCTPEIRQCKLSPIFINLLRDSSRWVRVAAFQALGPFVSTFADPSITALLHNDNGEIIITDPETLSGRLDDLETERAAEREEKQRLKQQQQEQQQLQQQQQQEEVPLSEQQQQPTLPDPCSPSEPTVIATCQSPEDHIENQDPQPMDLSTDCAFVHAEPAEETSVEERRAAAFLEKSPDEEENFNSFHYWREPVVPLDELEEDAPSKDSQDSNDEESTMKLFRPSVGSDSSPNDASSSTSQSTFDPRLDTLSSSPESASPHAAPPDPALPRGPPLTEQDIVPQLLIDHYVSMTDPSRAQTVDSDIARHCAFSLPAVALTLGRSNWPLLRETYEALATDMQWKVRRTLASSIHELGAILGQELSGSDLIPIFNGFLKDLDEVRMGLLKHLADFLRLLNYVHRCEFLPKLPEFLKMDNDRNWRFRLELAEQLGKLVQLYSPSDSERHVWPMVLVLIRDKVSSVRQTAVEVMAAILQSLLDANRENDDLTDSLLPILKTSLAHDEHWVHRQTFANLCYRVHVAQAVPRARFAKEILPDLLNLSKDKVPNVRLAVARTLSLIVQETDYYGQKDVVGELADRIGETESELKYDSDIDVRAFFGGSRVRSMTRSSGDDDEEEDDEEDNDVGASPL